MKLSAVDTAMIKHLLSRYYKGTTSRQRLVFPFFWMKVNSSWAARALELLDWAVVATLGREFLLGNFKCKCCFFKRKTFYKGAGLLLCSFLLLSTVCYKEEFGFKHRVLKGEQPCLMYFLPHPSKKLIFNSTSLCLVKSEIWKYFTGKM